MSPAASKTDKTSSASPSIKSPKAIVKREDGSQGISQNKRRRISKLLAKHDDELAAKTIKVVDVKKDNQSLESKVKVEVDDVLAESKRILKEKKKAAMKRPMISLTLDDNPDEVKEPLVMLDIQHLLLLGIMKNKASISPRWCRLLRLGKLSKVVAVVLDSVSSEEVNSYPESVPTLRQAFDIEANIIPPVQNGSSVREVLLNVQMISTGKLKKELGKLDTQKSCVKGKGVIIDKPEAKQYYPESEGLMYLETDKQRMKETVKCLEEKDFCLSHLYTFRNLMSSLDEQEKESEEKKQKCLKKLDRRIGKLISKIPANSLFVVILSSGLEGNEPTAKVLCKITGPQES